jgi:hypothetical protein
LSNQPQLTRITPTALLGSGALQLIEYLASLGNDFKTHAKWQGSIEEPAAKDFVARKVHTIKYNEVQGTHWNANKCQERLGNCPEAGFRQATIILYSRVWKSLGNSLPELYCVDLAKAYATQESVSLRRLGEKKRYDLQSPNGHLHEKPLAKGGTGKENRNYFLYQVPTSVLLQENASCVPEIWGRMYDVVLGEPKLYKNRMRNWIPVQQSKMQRN